VTERNYLEVYPYDKWASRTLPAFEQGEEFDPSSLLLKDGQTTPPKYLTEADLVTLMDKNGIGGCSPDLALTPADYRAGTDATIAQHIETIINRDYVIERMEGSTKYLVPSTLGIGLIEGYNQLGLPKSVAKPTLRREVCIRLLVSIHLWNRTKHLACRLSAGWSTCVKVGRPKQICSE
jgi:DNA topoisomerase-3